MPSKTEDGKPCFQLPSLKGSWAACAEGLEHPHTKEIRLITFDETVSRGRDDLVLVHLNHRLPQMCLRLLQAEVWAEKGRSKLQRVTARVVPNSIIDTPAVIAHARLVVIGGDTRVKERKAAIHRTLSARADKEAKDIESILIELKKSIEAELKDAAYIQPLLAGFDDPERERYERNKDAMRSRVKEIPDEIKRETEAIRARFTNPQARMFPVAVSFLVPEKMSK